MITAKELKELAPKTVEQIAKEFEPQLIADAKLGKTKIRAYDDKLINEGYNGTEQWNKFVSYMATFGYTVKVIYDERQLVDMAIGIEW